MGTPYPRGRFARLAAPAMLVWLSLLGRVFCERSGTDLPAWLHGAFVVAGANAALAAGLVTLWLMVRGRGGPDTLAGAINLLAVAGSLAVACRLA